MQLKQTHKQYGLITGLAVVIIGLLLYVLNLSYENWASYVALLPFLVGIILNANAFSKANDRYVTFGQTFGSCFKAVAIVALIGGAWVLLSSYIFPEMREMVLEQTQKSLLEQNKSDEEIEMAMKAIKKFYRVMTVGSSILMYMFVGVIFSLIAAAVAKKNGEMPPNMQAQ